MLEMFKTKDEVPKKAEIAEIEKILLHNVRRIRQSGGYTGRCCNGFKAKTNGNMDWTVQVKGKIIKVDKDAVEFASCYGKVKELLAAQQLHKSERISHD